MNNSDRQELEAYRALTQKLQRQAHTSEWLEQLSDIKYIVADHSQEKPSSISTLDQVIEASYIIDTLGITLAKLCEINCK